MVLNTCLWCLQNGLLQYYATPVEWSVQLGSSTEILQLLCVWRGRHQLWWHPPHFPCCGPVLPALSRCKVFNWVHLLHICWWSVMLVLVMWYQAGLYRVAQPVCVGSVAAIACHTGAFLHIPIKAIFPLLSTLYSVGPALMLVKQPH